MAENAGVASLTVQRTGDTNTVVTVDYATADGTATNGLKYAAVAGTLAFGAGETNQTIVVPILNDGFVGGTKNFKVILSNPTNAVLGTLTNATVLITDNDVGLHFQSATYSVAEDAGAVLIGVVRGNDGNFPVTVDVTTTDVTAKSGQDYTGITNTLTIVVGEKVKLFTVPILNDSLKEATKTFRVTLSNPVGATLGSQKTTTVTIADNDQGFQFELANSSVAEDAGVGLVSVLRGSDDTNSPMTVDYATSDLTAKAGEDYQAVSGTMEFKENETVKSLTVSILPDGIVESAKSFRVTLSNATGGAVLGTATTTVHIQASAGTYATLALPFDTALTIRRDLGFNTLTWAGGGLLQRADRPTGPWQTLTTARSPFTVQSPVPATFYRVQRPRPVNLYVPSGYVGQNLNGGFMAYRMACQSSDLIAGIASLNGAPFLEPSCCAPLERVNILHMHTTDDNVVPYGGGVLNIGGAPVMPPFPGAEKSVQI